MDVLSTEPGSLRDPGAAAVFEVAVLKTAL